MRRVVSIITLAAACTGLAWQAGAQEGPGGAAHEQWGMLDRYCTECHNFEDWAGEVAFDLMTPESVPEEPEIWETAVRKLQGRLMPPPGNPQPEQARIDEFVAWLESTLDNNEGLPRAGHVPVHRMNRTEYAQTVEDLLGVEIDGSDYLPTEIEVEGFDNIAEALSVSPSFLSQYIRAARHVARLAVGDGEAKPSVTFYPSPGGSQALFKDGMPPGTRGGMSFKHTFPADGEYRLNILDLDVGLYPRALDTRHTLVVLIDGTEVFRGELGGPGDIALVDRKGPAGREEIMSRFTDIPAMVKAGTHEVVVTFIERSRAQTGRWVGGGPQTRIPRVLNGVEVVGPHNPAGVSLTESREKIFICQPQSAAEARPCARRITENLARRAFRRPVTEQDMETLMPFFDQGRELGGFDRGIEQMVAAVLSSPHFLYRAVSPDKDLGEDAQYFALNDLELASRLSFFLWSQGPDETLLEAAIAGELSDPAELEAQVRRMLEDPRAAALVENFAMKWLKLNDLSDVEPNPGRFPEYNSQLQEDFKEEARRFIASILMEDRPVLELVTGDHTFLNERMARHYDINGVHGDQFRRVQLTDERRWGLLGKAAMLLRTSYGDRTSPVLRGAWVLEKLMGTPSPPPPPNVETDLSVPEGQKPPTLRARLEKHRANPSCNQCHGVIDPIGLALENFDVTGKWRDMDVQAEQPINASTELPTGAKVNGPVELRRELMRRPGQFVQAFTENLMMYALSRELEYFDMPQVRAIVREAEKEDYRLSAIVLGIVNSDAFRMQAMPHENEDGVEVAARTEEPGAESSN